MGIDKGGSFMAVNYFHISNPFANKTALSKQIKNGPQGVDLATPRLDQLQGRLEPQRQPLRPLRQLLQIPLFPRKLAVDLNVPHQLAPQVFLRLGHAEQVHGVHLFSDARLCVTTRF